MKKLNLTEGQELENLSLDLTDAEQVKKFINENESSMYGGKNNEGEDVVVLLEKGEELTIKTYQENGWMRSNYYGKNGYMEGETFEGRWSDED
jgi:hypothetical protein